MFAAFKDAGWGSRAGGMGNAFTAVANDASAVSWNPSGIAQVKSPEGTFMYNKLFLGLDNVNLGQMYAGFVYPVGDIGSFGLNVNDTYLSSLYREDTFALAYANDMSPFFWDKTPPFPVLGGFSVKYLMHQYILDERTKSLNDPVFANGTSAGAFTTDLGILLLPGRFSFGASVKNIVKADVGLYEKDFVPIEYRLGIAYKIDDWRFFEDILPTVDFSYRKPEDTAADVKIAGGLETWFSEHTYSARVGGSDREITAGFSFYKVILNIGVQLDYAFSWPLQLAETDGSHRLSLTFRQPLESEKPKAKEKEETEENKEIEITPPPAQKGVIEENPAVQPVPVVSSQTAPGAQPAAVVSPVESPELSPEQRKTIMKRHYDAALKHFKKGEYELAIAGWEEILKLDPNHEESKKKIEMAKQKLLEKQKRGK